jgi:hypothetical protein
MEENLQVVLKKKFVKTMRVSKLFDFAKRKTHLEENKKE